MIGYKKIKVFRKKLGLTQQELGKLLGVSQPTIVRAEKYGIMTIDLAKSISALAKEKHVRISVKELLGL